MINIKNVRVVDPASGSIYQANVELKSGKISKVENLDNGEVTEIPADPNVPETLELIEIDGEGLTLSPGLMDTHVHFRDPGLTYKEDIETGAKAAAAGGFTRVICMANTKPVIDSEETLRYVLEKGAKTDIHVMACTAVSENLEGKVMTDLEGLAAAGAAGFTDDGIPLLDEEFVKEAMRRAKALNMPISYHEEDKRLIAQNGINRGKVTEKLGIEGSPHEAEDVLVERDINLTREIGCKTVIQHISSGRAVELVRMAKAEGLPVFAEGTPHHFSLTEDAVLEYGTYAKMNPPLRTEEDRMAIIKGLADGTIDMIATDHAPHAKYEKEKPLTEAPSGIIGLETSLSLGITNLVRPGYLTIDTLLHRMTVGPAIVYGLKIPEIKVGEPADVVLFAEDEEWTPLTYMSKAENSPFTGKALYGKVKTTICSGRIVYMD